MARRGEPKQYVSGSFVLSFEHVDFAKLAGDTVESLINDRIVNLEIDHVLVPNSLTAYFVEQYEDYYRVFYTEKANRDYLDRFSFIMGGRNLMINPALN